MVDRRYCFIRRKMLTERTPYGGSLLQAEQEIYFEITILLTEIYQTKSRHYDIKCRKYLIRSHNTS